MLGATLQCLLYILRYSYRIPVHARFHSSESRTRTAVGLLHLRFVSKLFFLYNFRFSEMFYVQITTFLNFNLFAVLGSFAASFVQFVSVFWTNGLHLSNQLVVICTISALRTIPVDARSDSSRLPPSLPLHELSSH